MAETPVFDGERCENTEANLCVAMLSVCRFSCIRGEVKDLVESSEEKGCVRCSC